MRPDERDAQHRGRCAEVCCRVGDTLATPYRVLYRREQQCSANLRGQLDEAHRKLNLQGEVLRAAGMESGLDGLIDELAAIHLRDRRDAEYLRDFRMAMVRAFVEAQDAVDKHGVAPDLVLTALIKSLLKLNDRVKNVTTMRECRETVAALRGTR